MAAPTISINGTTMEMTFTDATTDFSWGTSTGTANDDAIFVKSITFEPSGADTMVVRDESLTGPALMRVSCVDTNDQKVIYFGERGKKCKPFIEGDDITLATPASAKLIFDLA